MTSSVAASLAALRRLSDSVHMASAATREVVAVDGFVLYLSSDAANPFMSFAVPEDVERDDWGTALAALPASWPGCGGVWTHPAFRRRGLARQACHALLAGAFSQGIALAWLSAAEGALALYEGLGFVRVGTQVNLEPP